MKIASEIASRLDMNGYWSVSATSSGNDDFDHFFVFCKQQYKSVEDILKIQIAKWSDTYVMDVMVWANSGKVTAWLVIPTAGTNANNNDIVKCAKMLEECVSREPGCNLFRRSETEKLMGMAKKYELILRSMDVHPVQHLHRDGVVPVKYFRLRHVAWMCVASQEMISKDDAAKATRWLGFVQGVLWSHEIRTVEQLRGDNVI